ncbi:MAG: cytochrome b N-terminal domain-containing protein [Thermoanaerobaculales bacterium]|nr:cytochrome b N-terminal domain-containing protein [Thermoanaerobaculales bacterium]
MSGAKPPASDEHQSRSAFFVEIWRSVFPRPIMPRTERERRRKVLEFFVLHMRPVRVRRSTLPYTHTFGLGGSSLTLIGLMVFTGVLLMLAYEPSPERAYDSVIGLQDQFLFGGLVRNIHHWSANLLVAVALLHLLRVLFTGGFHGPRRFNWVLGLGLLAGIMAANFTGYLLPWDQLAFWAVTICTGMFGYVPWIGEWLQGMARGGAEVGSATLVIFYTFHTTLVPVTLVLLMGFHFWRVRKAGGVVDSRPPEEITEEKPDYVSTLPELLMRELAAALALIAFVVVVSVFIDAPLGAPANPGMSTNPAKAPWYFVGFQELQLHFHPLIAVVVIPALVALALFIIPYLRYPREQFGLWFLSDIGRRTAVVAAVVGLCVTPVLILLDELVLQPGAGLPSLVGRGLVPLVVLGAVVFGFRAVLIKRFGASKGEVVQAVFVLFLAAFVVLTVTGVWFRGPGMALAWPWG